MSRYSVNRLLDTFFRRWWLYLVPFVVMCALGVVTVSSRAQSYKSTGTLYVASSTLLQKLNGQAPSTNWETAAVSTTKQLNSQLQTDQFVLDVAERAGVSDLVKARILTVEKIRSSMYAFDSGPNLLVVVSTSDNPQIAQRLAQSAMDAFVQSILDVNVGDSEAAIAYLDGIINVAKDDLTAAEDALDAYLQANPAPGFGQDRPDDQLAQIKRLNQAIDDASSRYDSAYSKREDAKLSTEQTKFDLGRQLRVVDPPQVPTAPQSGKKALVMGFGVFAAMGIFLTLASVVVAATLDHGIRYAADVRDRTGLRVLAVVPRSKALRQAAPKRSRRAEPPTIERQRLAPGSTPTRTNPGRGRGVAGGPGDRRGSDLTAPPHPPTRPAVSRPPAPKPVTARPAPTPPPPPAQAPAARTAAPAARRERPVAEVENARVEGESDSGSWSRRRRPVEADSNGASGQGWPPGRRRGGDVPHAS